MQTAAAAATPHRFTFTPGTLDRLPELRTAAFGLGSDVGTTVAALTRGLRSDADLLQACGNVVRYLYALPPLGQLGAHLDADDEAAVERVMTIANDIGDRLAYDRGIAANTERN